MKSNSTPSGYLELCTVDALESLLLARMNQSANLGTEIRELVRSWVEAEVDVNVARWMLEHRRSQTFRAGAAPLPIEGAAVVAARMETLPFQRKPAQLFSANSDDCYQAQSAVLPIRAPRSRRDETGQRTNSGMQPGPIDVASESRSIARRAVQLPLPIDDRARHDSASSSCPRAGDERHNVRPRALNSRVKEMPIRMRAERPSVIGFAAKKLLLPAPRVPTHSRHAVSAASRSRGRADATASRGVSTTVRRAAVLGFRR